MNETPRCDYDDDYQQEEHSIYSVFNMEASGRSKDYSVDLKLGGNFVKFQLDTGSARTIVNEAVYRNMFSDHKLKESSTLLRSYTKEEIPILGEFEVAVEYGEQCVPRMLLLVVKGDQPCLLGRDWLSKIKLKWENIFSVTSKSVETLQKEYQDVFQEKFQGSN